MYSHKDSHHLALLLEFRFGFSVLFHSFWKIWQNFIFMKNIHFGGKIHKNEFCSLGDWKRQNNNYQEPDKNEPLIIF